MSLVKLASRILARRQRLVVPERFNRNSATVTALMPPEQSGRLLLERMRQRIGFETYADRHVLDFGCGVRFTQAIVNTGLPFGSYTGIDNCRELIEFLQRHVRDRRFAYHFLDARHPLYNESGIPLTSETRLPVAPAHFDVVSMFSVITHQSPADARAIFEVLRRHVKLTGYLFFTCFLDENVVAFEDRSAEQNGGRCFYNRDYLTSLVEGCGWRIVNHAPGEGPLIGDSFLCAPS